MNRSNAFARVNAGIQGNKHYHHFMAGSFENQLPTMNRGAR